MTMIFSCLVKLASAAAISSVGLSSPMASPPALSPQGEIIGVPTVGMVGITETTEQIMARDKVLNNYPILPKQEHEWELDKQPNPEAPAVPTWPPLTTAAPTDKGGQVKIQSPQPIGTQFTGATLANSGGFVPPDSHGASGITDIVVVANTWIRSFSKTGVLGSLNTNMNNFFASVGGGSGTSDPRVIFDPLSQRYYVAMINLSTPNRVMLRLPCAKTRHVSTPPLGIASMAFVESAITACWICPPSAFTNGNSFSVSTLMLMRLPRFW